MLPFSICKYHEKKEFVNNVRFRKNEQFFQVLTIIHSRDPDFWPKTPFTAIKSSRKMDQNRVFDCVRRCSTIVELALSSRYFFFSTRLISDEVKMGSYYNYRKIVNNQLRKCNHVWTYSVQSCVRLCSTMFDHSNVRFESHVQQLNVDLFITSDSKRPNRCQVIQNVHFAFLGLLIKSSHQNNYVKWSSRSQISSGEIRTSFQG